MSDPIRLRDDPATSELLRKDLDIAKDHASVTYDVEAGLAALTQKTGPSGGSSGGGPSLKAIGAASGIAGVGIAVIITAIVVSRPPDAPPSEPVTDEVEAPETAPDPIDEAPSEAEPETPEALEVVEPDVVPEREPVREAPPDPLAEAREIAEARRSLASDPAHTLAIVERHRRTYRPGLYREEREALAILALDRLGRTAAARPRAVRFLARFPASAFRERIARIAGESDREAP